MRIYTKVIWNNAGRAEKWFIDYYGPIAWAKGDQTAKAAEQTSLQNQQQQMQFSQQLMDVFQKQYGDQKQVLDYLQSKVQPMIDNPQGYDPKTLAAMNTSASDTLSTEYQNAQKALQNNINSKNGGSDLPSGSYAQLQEALFGSEASDKANAANSITVADANLKNSNLWNAINVMQGTAAQLNPQSYAGGATGASDAASSAGNATAGLSQAYQASKKGFFSNLANSFASGLGSGLGGGVSGGLGTAMSTVGSGSMGW